MAAALLPLPAAVAEVKAGAMGTSAASFGLAELLLVSVLQERTQGTAVSLGMAEADRDLLPCAKAPQEDPGNPCPGEMVILSLLKDSDIFLLLSY